MSTIDQFWLNNPYILIDDFWDFFPSIKASYNLQLNSILRFAIYTSLILSIYHGNYNYMYIAVICGITEIYLYGKESKEGMNNTSVYDSRNNIYRPETRVTHPMVITQGTQPNCTRPTLDNPFMNFTNGDMMNIGPDGKIIDKPEACKYTDSEIKKESEFYFNQNLYRDATDLFNNQNSQREFYSMPSTTFPNDRETFQNALYKTPETCKENTRKCYRNEDLRQKSRTEMNFVKSL